MSGHARWSDTKEKMIYERAKERNDGREPDELHLAYERELLRLRQIEAALRTLVTLKDGPRDEAYEENKPHAWENARAVLNLT